MFKGILQVARGEFRLFILNSKMIVVLFAVIYISESLMEPVRRLCEESGLKISFMEPYLLLTDVEGYSLVIPLVFLILMSGFPSHQSFNYFSLIRISRLQWLLGEMLFVCAAAVSYIFLILLGLIAYMRHYLDWINGWSGYMLDFHKLYPEEYLENASYFLRSDMMTHGSPLFVFGHSLCLMVCMLLTVALLQMTFALMKKSLIGMLLSVGITLMAAPMIHHGVGKLKWMFPMPHANFALHFNGFLAEKNFGIGMSYIYFAVLIAILVSVDVMLMKKIPMGGQ